jgi:hypothetical protein
MKRQQVSQFPKKCAIQAGIFLVPLAAMMLAGCQSDNAG